MQAQINLRNLIARPRDDSPIYERIHDFGKTFSRAHLILLMHAAIPQYITPELLNLLRRNFAQVRGGDYYSGLMQSLTRDDDYLILTSDFFAPVRQQVRLTEQDNFYVMPERVRDYLLREVRRTPKLENQRIKDVGWFLFLYVDQLEMKSRDEETQRLWHSQKIHAITLAGVGDTRKALMDELSEQSLVDDEQFRETLEILNREDVELYRNYTDPDDAEDIDNVTRYADFMHRYYNRLENLPTPNEFVPIVQWAKNRMSPELAIWLTENDIHVVDDLKPVVQSLINIKTDGDLSTDVVYDTVLVEKVEANNSHKTWQSQKRIWENIYNEISNLLEDQLEKTQSQDHYIIRGRRLLKAIPVNATEMPFNIRARAQEIRTEVDRTITSFRKARRLAAKDATVRRSLTLQQRLPFIESARLPELYNDHEDQQTIRDLDYLQAWWERLNLELVDSELLLLLDEYFDYWLNETASDAATQQKRHTHLSNLQTTLDAILSRHAAVTGK